jgi:hypothetical protein
VGLQLVRTAGYCKRMPNPSEPIFFFTQHGYVDAVLQQLRPRAAAAAPELLLLRVEVHEGVHVVRDDLLPGGTKRWGLTAYVAACLQHTEFVYASPREGYACKWEGSCHVCTRETGWQVLEQKFLDIW